MSARENVATVERFTAFLQSGDYEAAAAMISPDFTVDDTDIPESTGEDSFRRWIGRWDAAWESWRIEDLQIRPIGEDRALSLFRIIVRGKGSGVELAREDASLAAF